MPEPEFSVLTRRECFEHLSRVPVGRVGVTIDALPAILPVYFAVGDDSVFFRTSRGTRLDAAAVGAVVAFQADAWEPSEGIHWSVMLQGVASEVGDDPADVAPGSAGIKSWEDVHPIHRLVRLHATNATGRRLRIAGEGPQVEFPGPPAL